MSWTTAALALAPALLPKKKAKKRKTMSKEQEALHNNQIEALQNGTGPLADMYGFDQDAARENFMNKYAQPAYQKYNEEIVPGITGAFRSKGLGKSSYAGQALAREGRNVQTNINNNLEDYLYKGQQSAYDRRAQGINSATDRTTFDYEKPEDSYLEGMIKKQGGRAASKLADYYSP